MTFPMQPCTLPVGHNSLMTNLEIALQAVCIILAVIDKMERNIFSVRNDKTCIPLKQFTIQNNKTLSCNMPCSSCLLYTSRCV